MGCTAQYETDGQGKVYAKLLVRLFDLVASLVFILHRYERKYLSGYILEIQNTFILLNNSTI